MKKYKHVDGKEYEIKEYIKVLKAEGKETAEIAGLVASQDDTKDVKEIVAEVNAQLKAIQAEGLIRADEAKTAKDAEIKEAVKAVVADEVKSQLKDIPALKQNDKPEVKSFSIITRKFESKGLSEDYKAFANLCSAVAHKQTDNMNSIGKEIAQQKETDYKNMGILDIKTALYSDATTGSYMIPTEVEGEIWERAYQGTMLSLLNNKAIPYNDKLYPVLSEMTFADIADESTQLGDKTPTVGNPSISMGRFGGLAYASNSLLQMKGAEFVRALISQAGDAVARYADLRTVAGSITGNSDNFNGIIFDANTSALTAGTLAGASIADLRNLKNTIAAKFRDEAVFIGNSLVRDTYGSLEDGSGNPLFKNFVESGQFRPYGKEFVENAQIPSTFDIATSKRTTGTDDIVGCIVPSACYVGFTPLRIDTSEHFKFDYDQYGWRFISRMGFKVVSASGTQGIVACFKKLTN